MEKRINMKEFFQSEFLISSAKGDILLPFLIEEIKTGNKLILDFKDIKSTITAFFFSGYGPLFKDYSLEFIKETIKFENENEGTKQQIETVEELSIIYYKENK